MSIFVTSRFSSATDTPADPHKNSGATTSPRCGMLGFHLTPVSARGSGDTSGSCDAGNAASPGFFGGGPAASV
jgi:hypothetical protein